MAIMKGIVAVDRDWAIGKNGHLLFNIPEDMKFFKDTTLESNVVMGGTTFKSLGGKKLLRRTNIVLTRSPNAYKNTKSRIFMTADDFDAAFKRDRSDTVFFIIGGEQIYKRYYRQCSEIFVTMIDTMAEDPDRYFPDLNYCKEFRFDKIIKEGESGDLKYKITSWRNISL